MTLAVLSRLHLDEPATAGAGSPNFFNGRLLTGEDLAAEQDAGRLVDAQLARLGGPGVAHGLEVELVDPGRNATPTVRVRAGTAVTAAGELLTLDRPSLLELRRTPPRRGAVVAAFAQCTPAAVAAAGQAQLHLLTIGRAAPEPVGRAAVVDLGNAAAPCAVDRLATAVTLRLRPFAVPLPPGPATRLRSHAASLLLGDAGPAEPLPADDPLGPGARSGGLLEALRGRCFGHDEIPLAVVRWPSAAAGVEFVDRWAARRALHQPGAAGVWDGLLGGSRAVRAQARSAQVQEHLADLLGPTAAQLVATERFVTLPPAFVLPVRDAEDRPVFDRARFLRGLTLGREAWVEGARVGALLAAAAEHPAVDLLASPPEALWAYLVRPTRRPFGPPRHVLVVSGHVAHAADAQLDLAHFDQATYAVPTT